jgi:anti-sigma factor RsiW
MNFSEFSELSTSHCPTEEVLLDYTAGRLDRAQSALFERHAEKCARCAALRTAQAAVWRSLDEWKPAPVGAGFNRELWRRIDSDARVSSRRRRFAEAVRFSFWKPVAPLAVAVALTVAGFVLDHPGKRPEKPLTNTAASIIVTASDADQLERALDDIQLLHEVDAESAEAKPDSKLM